MGLMEEGFLKKRLCSEARGDDKISKLPDSLISQMLLSHLPTKDVVRTSLLSKRWKNLWLLNPSLDLDAIGFPDYNAFVSFVDRFLNFSRDSCLHKLKLSIRRDENDQNCVNRWIASVVNRKLKYLDLECHVKRQCFEEIPVSLSETLVYLRLYRVLMGDFKLVFLPCLKIMRLEQNVYANGAAIELLISSSPVLEDLSIARRTDDNVKVLRVQSQTLTSLSLEFYYWEEGYEREADDVDFEHEGTMVLIDAPKLKYLNFEDDISESKIISNTGSLAKVNVVGAFNLKDCFDLVDLPMQNMIRNYFSSFSRVKDMVLSAHTVEYLYYNTQIEPLPQFCNLSCLEMNTMSRSFLEMLPRFLESFPNLTSLVIGMDLCLIKESEELTISSVVPRCLVSSLEFVEIKSRFYGVPAEMEVVRYIVENSVVLKKLVLHLSCSMSRVFMDLLALPRRSSTCRIICG